jgi:hypothetical protein
MPKLAYIFLMFLTVCLFCFVSLSLAQTKPQGAPVETAVLD